MTPLQQAAYDIGAKGSEPTEEERIAFEAWMRGHCWKVIGDWDGKQYKHDCEDGGFVHGGAMETRRLWAAWRDRGAVARVLAEQVAVPQEPVAWLVRWLPTKHEPRDINPWVALSIAEYRSNPSREERPLVFAAPQGDKHC